MVTLPLVGAPTHSHAVTSAGGNTYGYDANGTKPPESSEQTRSLSATTPKTTWWKSRKTMS